MRRSLSMLLVVLLAASCAATVDTSKESASLLQRDKEWSAAAGNVEQWSAFLASDATFYPAEMPMLSGSDTIKTTFAQLHAAPGFSLSWMPLRSVVSSDGNWGYTTGTYSSGMAGTKEEGKYVTIWKKVNNAWMVAEDIFNASKPPVYPHAMIQASALKWGEAPPGLPAGGKFAVVSGDPSQPGPFVLRADLPAGYRIGPHWHPTTENLTVLHGTVSMNMGDKDDPATRTDVPAGGYVVLPVDMRHAFFAKTNVSIQVHGMGPFGITYVNPSDDPRNKK